MEPEPDLESDLEAPEPDEPDPAVDEESPEPPEEPESLDDPADLEPFDSADLEPFDSVDEPDASLTGASLVDFDPPLASLR